MRGYRELARELLPLLLLLLLLQRMALLWRGMPSQASSTRSTASLCLSGSRPLLSPPSVLGGHEEACVAA